MIDFETQEEKILNEVTSYVSSEVSFLEALVIFAEKHGMEIEVLGEIVKNSIVLNSKVEEDAEDLNLIEKSVRLPI